MIVAFIPARGGSKSIPRKNLKELGGRSLLAWTIETALAAGLGRVVVSTEDAEIAKVARQYGAEVLERPPELATDTTSMYEVVKHEVPKIDPMPELVMLLQPTSPFRETNYIKIATSYLSNNLNDFDSLISVERVPDRYNPAQVIVNTPLGHRMANGAPISQRITRRQDHPEAWVPTGEIYLFKTANLDKGSMYGERVLLLEVAPGININSMQDFEAAEKILMAKSKPVLSASKVMHIAEDGICESCE